MDNGAPMHIRVDRFEHAVPHPADEQGGIAGTHPLQPVTDEHGLGGYRVQGRGEDEATRVIDDAVALQAAGAFAVVLEMIPSDVAAQITKELAIPTIGIGAGPDCDAQVMVWTDMVNQAGKRVQPTMAAFQSAAANADFSKVQDFYLILTNQPGAASWPITAATYMLMRDDYAADRNKNVLQFLDYALHDGAADAQRLDYVPFPDSVVKQIEASWPKTLHVTP